MKNRLPKICRRKDRNLAFVTIDGVRIYLGVLGSPAAQAEYKKTIAGYLDGTAPVVEPDRQTVADLAAAFLAHTKNYYVKNGRTTGQHERFCAALEPVLNLYGTTPIIEFDSAKLGTVQRDLETSGRFCRSYINTLINCVRKAFKWGVSKKMATPVVLADLQTLEPLKTGRSLARESPPVKPVDVATVEKTIPFLTSPVATMVRLQLLLGCRPGEICEMRACDLDVSGPIWTYYPESWKTQHFARNADDRKRIAVGPQAQGILPPYLAEKEPNEYLFSPRDAWRDHARELRQNRKTPGTPSQRARDAARRDAGNARLGDRYSADAYGKSVRKGAKKAGVESWSPNQLRHLAATIVRERYGLEAAQCVLGHARADTTQIYAERDFKRAVEIASEIG